MDYFNILNFKKEPFSNSPEPEFLFQLPQYSECLQKLELAVRLRRGINVVIGDIGTGKTTLCRKFIQNLSSSLQDSEESEIETHLLLDPAFKSTTEFLQTCALMLGIGDLDEGSQSEWHLKERIKDKLFEKGVDKQRIVVLILDEGQKIPDDCLEILREFLNYETNKFKLLQIIIFAQKEFQTILRKKANLADRVNLLIYLRRLNFRQTKAMIDYRLSVARNFEKSPSLFRWGGFFAIYLATRGYPRKVVFLCHQVVLKMIIRGKSKAGWFMVRRCVREIKPPLYRKLEWGLAILFLIFIVGFSVRAITFQNVTEDAGKKHKLIASDSKISDSQDIVRADNASDADVPVVNLSPNITMPDYMGSISMTKRRTLWWTLFNIYGDNGHHISGKVIAANPHIHNENMITEGTTISLPSIPADNHPVKHNDIVIALESGKDLEKIYNNFRNNPENSKLPPLAFLSYWNRKKGFEFAVVIDKKFRDNHSAEEAKGNLPPEIAVRARMISQWDTDDIFFNRHLLQY